MIADKKKKDNKYFVHKTRATFILSNPFYTGLFRYAGEIYEGKHQPVVSKKIFDKVQEVLKERGQTATKVKKRSERRGFIAAKSMGGSANRPRIGLKKTALFCSGGQGGILYS